MREELLQTVLQVEAEEEALFTRPSECAGFFTTSNLSCKYLLLYDLSVSFTLKEVQCYNPKSLNITTFSYCRER